MDPTRFWGLIDQARLGKDPRLPSASPETLKAVLGELSDDDVIDFGAEFTRRIGQLNRWRVWGAGNAIVEDMSGDGFHGFRAWLVGKGRLVANLALSEPDALGPYIDDPEVENESLEYVALEVLGSRGIELDPRDGAGDADAPPAGDPYDEDVEKEYPRLTARFGEIRGRYWDPEGAA